MRKRLTFLVMAVLAAYTLAMTFMTLMAVRTAYPYTELDAGWDVTVAGETFSDVRLTQLDKEGLPEIRKGDIVILKRLLPVTEEVPFPTLSIKVRYCAYEVFLDGEPVMNYRMEDLETDRFIGSSQQFISFPRGAEGHEMEIVLHAVKDRPFRYIAAPHFGNYDDVSHMFLHDHMFPFLSGVYLFIFGILFFVIAISFVARMPEMRVTLISALLCIELSVWTLCKYDLINLFFYVGDKTIPEYIALYAIPLTIISIILVTGNFSSKKRLLLLTSPLLFAVAWNYFGLLTGMFPINRYRNLFFITVTIASIVILMETVACFMHGIETARQIQMVSLTVLNVMILAEILVYVLELRDPRVAVRFSGVMLPAGGLVYSLGQVMNFFVFVTRAYVQRAEAASLRRMAYEDILTGLANRASYDREVRRLDAEGISYCMISLDLNGLKETNDTQGHAYGDRLLARFGAALKDVFGDIGFCSRIGGDEFAVILRGARDPQNREDVEKRLKELEERVAAQNPGADRFLHSAAYGYAFSEEREGMYAHDVFLLADGRMYDMKRQQHAQLL